MVIEQMCINDVQTTTRQIQNAISDGNVDELDRLRVLIRADRRKLEDILDAMPKSDRAKDFNRCIVENLYDASIALSAAATIASTALSVSATLGSEIDGALS